MYSAQNRMGRIQLKAPEGRPSILEIQYYPVRGSYSDASETRDLYPPIQITGDCQWTNGKSSRGSQEEGPPPHVILYL